jgi:RecA-family ATPase
MNRTNGLDTFSLKEVLLEPEEADGWIIEDLIAPGLHLLVGPPKVGKSWMSLGMGIAVCQGDPFLGFATEKCKVLYLALEDPRARIKKRAWKLLDETTGELYFATAASKVSSGLIPQIENHLEDYPGTRLVIIDTFQMVRESTKDSAYAADYADLTPLKKMADKNGIAVVVIHHTRKMGDADVFNTVSGTTGLTGCADSTMVLSNVNRADGNATLTLTGRDREFLELKVRFKNCAWHLVEVTSQEELEERDVPDDVLRTLDFMTREPGQWQGTATDLIRAVGATGVSVATFGKHLAQHSSFMKDRGVEYSRKHMRTGTMLTLEHLATNEGGEDDG